MILVPVRHGSQCSTGQQAIRERYDEATNIRLAVRVKYSSHQLLEQSVE